MMNIDLSLFRAIPEPRGCGDREPGGVYAESGVGPFGFPLEHFLIDPPMPLPPGLDLVNKARIMPREWLTGEPEVDEAGQPVYDLLIHTRKLIRAATLTALVPVCSSYGI